MTQCKTTYKKGDHYIDRVVPETKRWYLSQ